MDFRIWVLPLAAVILSSLLQLASSQDVEDVATTSDIPTITSGTPPTIMDRSSHHHASPSLKGFWRKKFTWRPRWVKTWQPKKIFVAVWKRMWGPAELREWVPVPPPPPGWVKHSGGPVVVKLRTPSHHG